MRILAYFACILYAAWQVPSLQAEEWTVGHSTRLSSKGVTSTANLMSERHEMSDQEHQHKQRGLDQKWRMNRKFQQQLVQEQLNDMIQPPTSASTPLSQQIKTLLLGAKLSKPQHGPNFTAITVSDGDSLVPPDSNGSVGPTQYIAFTNNWIRSFNKKTGKPDGVLNLSPESFFASVMPEPTPGVSHFLSDPRLLYDAKSHRWFAVMITFSVNEENDTLIPDNQVVLAVSDKKSRGVITEKTKWDFYSFLPGRVSPESILSSLAFYFADFPTLGIDRHALYLGVNVFSVVNGGEEAFITADLFVINKHTLLHEEELQITPFRYLSTFPTFSFEFPSLPTFFTPQGATNFDKHSAHGVIMGIDIANQQLVMRLIDKPGSDFPSISAPIPIATPPLAPPGAPFTGVDILTDNFGVPAKETIGRLDAVGLRLSAAHIRHHQLYTSQSVSVDQTGNSGVNFSSLDRTGSRWYQISVENLHEPQLVQYGTLFDSSNTPTPLNYWMSAVMTNHYDTLFIGSSVAGVNAYADAAIAFRYSGDTPGTLRTPETYTHSTTSYNRQPTSFIKRWGDYSTLSADPTSKGNVWSIQEFCNDTDSWAVQVLELKQHKKS